MIIVLDTNILVRWLRGKGAGAKLRADYGARRPRPILPVVVKAEIQSLAVSAVPRVVPHVTLREEFSVDS